MNNQQPPSQFQIETESKASSNNNNHQKWPCKLCRVDRKKFICKSCLCLGAWISTNNINDSERWDNLWITWKHTEIFTFKLYRFVDKQLKLKNLKNAQKQLENKFNAKFESFIRLENLRSSILQSRSKNSTLSEIIKEKRVNIQKLRESKKENHEKNRAQRIILPRYEDKVNKLVSKYCHHLGENIFLVYFYYNCRATMCWKLLRKMTIFVRRVKNKWICWRTRDEPSSIN